MAIIPFAQTFAVAANAVESNARLVMLEGASKQSLNNTYAIGPDVAIKVAGSTALAAVAGANKAKDRISVLFMISPFVRT